MRQYYYSRRSGFGGSFLDSWVNKVVVATVAVYVLQQLFRPGFTRVFSLSPWAVVHKFYVWQIFTYMFLHFNVWHLLFNMFIVWMFGSALESVWGSRRFFRYYITCGVSAALFAFIFAYNSLTLGASGAGFGLLLAYGMLFPDNLIYIWFLFPVKAKHLVIFLGVFQLLQGISGPSNIAYFAHLGGMAGGLLFFRDEISRWSFFSGIQWKWRRYTRERRTRTEENEQEKVDSILDKISRKGYEELTETEKRILENYSRKRKGDSN